MTDKKNLVKQVCSELGISQKELAARLGMHEISVGRWSHDIPKSAEKTLELLLENHKLKEKCNKIDAFMKLLDELKSN
jgi:transcriptional regulator with XRE-family HTH domain